MCGILDEPIDNQTEFSIRLRAQIWPWNSWIFQLSHRYKKKKEKNTQKSSDLTLNSDPRACSTWEKFQVITINTDLTKWLN